MSARKDRLQPRVRLYLEQLESRELLSASFEQLGPSSLVGDLMRLNSDLETSTRALVNAVQAAPANVTSLAPLHSQWCQCWSLLTADWNQTVQDAAQFEHAWLQMGQQEFRLMLASLGFPVPNQSSQAASSIPSNHGADITMQPAGGPNIGDPAISATEGVQFSGTVASLSDSDGDGIHGNVDGITGTINWGDNTSSTFGLQVPEVGSANLVANHTWTEIGTYTVTITANDPDGGQSQITETANVSDGQLNWYQPINGEPPPPGWGQPFDAGPSITAPLNQTNLEGSSVNVQVQASNADGDSFSYAALNLPPGLSINSGTGLITGTVAYGDATDFDGTYNPTIIVADGDGTGSATSFTWTILQAQIAPVLTNPGTQINLRGDSVSLQLNATQIDNDPLTYSASNLPTGLSLDAETGLISGTVDPSATLGAPYAVTVTATDDSTNLSASQSFNWTISAANVAPVLTNPGTQTNSAGDQVSLQLSAADADGDNLTYTATGLPPGLTLDPIAGIISGTLPNSAASSTPYNVTVSASDGIASNSQSFTWMVNVVSLQNPGAQSNLDGDKVSLQLTASDAKGKSLTYSATGLPPGLSINSSTGLISGTLSNTADTGSPYNVTVTAKDSSNYSLSQSFTWTVARLALNNPGNQENQEGKAVSLQLSATDHVGTPTYSAAGLPPGLSINSTTGVISGSIASNADTNSPYSYSRI